MSNKTRAKLKKLFSNGSMPSQVDFADLIDSNINPIDDGFNITPEGGIQVAPTDSRVFASVYAEKGEMIRAKWRFEIDDTGNHFLLSNNIENNDPGDESNAEDSQQEKASGPIVSISGREEKIGISKAVPEYTLDINGTVASSARLGTYKTGFADANSKWQDILTGLEGCHMFEVIAGVSGGEKQGRYSLVKAVAMNCYNPDFLFSWFRKRIKHQHSWYFSRWDRIKLRWKKDGPNTYKLQIKTVRNFKTGKTNYQIKYHVTQLWVENTMRYNYDDGED
jgi:hypothetical protein